MRGRWSFGVVVAIAIAVCVATSGGAPSSPARHASQPVEVTLALQPEGASLRISHDAFAVTLTF
jgi:hypothetical protein